MFVRPGVPQNAGLADWLDQFCLVPGRAPGLTAIAADGSRTAALSEISAHVQQQSALFISQLDHLTLIHFRANRSAEFPGPAVVVAVNDMRAVFDRQAAQIPAGFVISVIARNHQPSAPRPVFDLNANTRPGRVPTP